MKILLLYGLLSYSCIALIVSSFLLRTAELISLLQHEIVATFFQHTEKRFSFDIRKKINTVKEQPPRLCKNNNAKINYESAIRQHLITNPECAKTYTDYNFRIFGKASSSFHLRVLEPVYIKSENPVLCRQKELVFSLGLFKQTMANSS